MKVLAQILLFLFSTATFAATNVGFAFANNGCAGMLPVQLSNESGFNMSIAEIFVLVFCFLFAVGLVLLWQFCFRKKP
jgi:hypothetical protein